MSWPQRNAPSASTTPSTMSPACVPPLISFQLAPPSVDRHRPDRSSKAPKYPKSAGRGGSGINPWACRWPWKVDFTDQVAPRSEELQSRIGVEAVGKTWYSMKKTAPSSSARLCGVSVRYEPVSSTSFQVAPWSVERARPWPELVVAAARRTPPESAVITQRLPGADPRLDQLRPSTELQTCELLPFRLTAY